MSNKDNRNVTLNIVSSLFLQIIIIFRGIVIPRLILQYFGSEINGLLSSITQFLNFFAVMEGGIAGVILASLYQPIVENDYKAISKIVRASKEFLRKLAFGFLVYMIAFAVAYSFWERQFGWKYIVGLVLILGATTFMEYYFTMLPQLIIRASNKAFICNTISIFFIFGSLLAMLICFKVYPQLHFVKFISAAVYIFQPILLNAYIKKYYVIDKKSELDRKLLSERWDGFGINLANIITTNTDVMVLTFFSSLETVSIYSIYYSVIAALKGLAHTLNFGYQAYIGQEYAKGNAEKLSRVFSQYELLMINISGVLFTCCMEVIVPFISIYTRGINDANYNQPLFSIILSFAMMVLCLREPYLQMAYSAGLFKKTSKYAYIEAGINIILSIILVQRFGISGVAIGTLLSSVYRLIANVNFLQNNILFRNKRVAYRKILVYFIPISISSVIFRNLIVSTQIGIVSWFVKAIIVFSVNAVLFIVIDFIFYRDELKEIRNFYFLR